MEVSSLSLHASFPLPRLRITSYGLIRTRVLRPCIKARTENYRLENSISRRERRHLPFIVNRHWSIPFSRFTHTTHLVPDIRYSSFLLLRTVPDTMTKHAVPYNSARLHNDLPYGIVSRTWSRCCMKGSHDPSRTLGIFDSYL